MIAIQKNLLAGYLFLKTSRSVTKELEISQSVIKEQESAQLYYIKIDFSF